MSILPRHIRIEDDIAYIPLTRGYEAIIDAADVPLVVGCSWIANISLRRDGSIKVVYARARVFGNLRTMHRVLLSAPIGIQVDHKDSNGLNNRRSNLRLATNAENQFNQRPPINNTSGVKGVNWSKVDAKWRARITVTGYQHHLGLFKNIEDAAAAYAQASITMHGDFGRLR